MADSNKKAYGNRSLDEQSAIDAEIEEQYEEFYAESYSGYSGNVDELFENGATANNAGTSQTEPEPSKEGEAEPSAETQPDPEEEKGDDSAKNDQEEKRKPKSNLTYRASKNGEQEIEEDPNILSEEEKSRIKKAVAWVKEHLTPRKIILGIWDFLTEGFGIAVQNILLGQRVQRELENFVQKESEKDQNKKKDEKETDQKRDTEKDQGKQDGPGRKTEPEKQDGPGKTTEPGAKDDPNKTAEQE